MAIDTRTHQLPQGLDDALYTALRAFYGDNRAVGAVEAVKDTLFAYGVVVTRCDPTLREILELDVSS
jgi:hypothetical protein